MGSNGIFVTLMVLQRDTNTFCFSSSLDNINTDTTLSPQMSQPSESCWDRLLSKKGNRTLCLHFLKHHFTTRQGPKTPVASSLVWSVKPHEIHSPIHFAPGIHVEGIFFNFPTCLKLNKYFFVARLYMKITNQFWENSHTALLWHCLCFGEGVIDRQPLSLPCAPFVDHHKISDATLFSKIIVSGHVGICDFAL